MSLITFNDFTVENTIDPVTDPVVDPNRDDGGAPTVLGDVTPQRIVVIELMSIHQCLLLRKPSLQTLASMILINFRTYNKLML